MKKIIASQNNFDDVEESAISWMDQLSSKANKLDYGISSFDEDSSGNLYARVSADFGFTFYINDFDWDKLNQVEEKLNEIVDLMDLPN